MGTCRNLDLYLVRHGLTDWNQQKRYLGHTDRSVMTEELIMMADLRQELNDIAFDLVYTSDLRRCTETLDYLTLPVEADIDDRLREMDFGQWEGKTYEDLKNIPAYREWVDDWEQHSPPNGESWQGFKERIDAFMKDLMQQLPEKTTSKIFIMTHGGVIRYLLTKFGKPFWESSVKHGQGIHITLTKHGGEWLCSSLSEVPLPGKEK